MKISEAIELKELTGQAFLNADPDELDKADRLSIEALKRIQNARAIGYSVPAALLPSETEE